MISVQTCNPYTSQFRTSLWESLYLPEKQAGSILQRYTRYLHYRVGLLCLESGVQQQPAAFCKESWRP